VLDVADATAAACRAERVPALVGTLDDARAGAMLSLSPRADPDRVLHGLATRITERGGGPGTGRDGSGSDGLVIGVGAAVGSIRDVRRSFLEATQVADVAAERPDGWTAGTPDGRPAGSPDGRPAGSPDGRAARRPDGRATRRPDGHGPGRPEDAGRPLFYRLADLRLRGLVHLLRDDPRMQTFVERELGPLLAAEPDTSLLDVLAAYLAAGGNKAEAAKHAHLARPTFYERLRKIERILGTDLGSAESRTSLHVALLALEAARTT
jgi:purine catabolism regulator